jgi:hypothetical protein
MAFGALDMRDHADAAGVMFVGGVVETLGGGVSHGKSPICQMPSDALWRLQAERAHGGDYSGQGSAQAACLARFAPSCRQEAVLAMGLREVLFLADLFRLSIDCAACIEWTSSLQDLRESFA